MRIEEYREYLQAHDLHADSIEKQITVVNELVTFLTTTGRKNDIANAGMEEVEEFARKLIDEEKNTYENFIAMCNYADWLDHRKLYVALVELMDCSNAMSVLTDKIKEKHGQKVCDQIFCEPLPPLGANEKERYAHARVILGRMEEELTPEESRFAWYQVQHGISEDYWNKSDTTDKEKFQQCKNIDEFLELKRNENKAMLNRLRNEGKLWYTQEINDEVLEFVTCNPEIEGGRREEDKIYITKIPYNTLKFLHATDEKMKRYYACHCPIVREAILRDELISTKICECSLGHASHYLAGLDRELKGEVLESVLKGDIRCRFVFYLPNDDAGS